MPCVQGGRRGDQESGISIVSSFEISICLDCGGHFVVNTLDSSHFQELGTFM